MASAAATLRFSSFSSEVALRSADAAGNDQVEITQVGGNVVGETVGSDPAADVHADGGEFFFGSGYSLSFCWLSGWMNPDAGAAWDAKGREAEIGGGADHHFFEGADIPVDITFYRAEIEDGVANDLTWAVESDVATAIGVVERNIFLAQYIFVGEKIFAFGVAAEGDDWRVFAQQEDIGDRCGFAGGDHALLQRIRVRGRKSGRGR